MGPRVAPAPAALLAAAAGLSAGVGALIVLATHAADSDTRASDVELAIATSRMHDCIAEPRPAGPLGDDEPSRFLCENGRYELIVSPRPDSSGLLARGPGISVVKSGWNWIVVVAPAVPASAPAE
jgi:hypothetical protein